MLCSTYRSSIQTYFYTTTTTTAYWDRSKVLLVLLLFSSPFIFTPSVVNFVLVLSLPRRLLLFIIYLSLFYFIYLLPEILVVAFHQSAHPHTPAHTRQPLPPSSSLLAVVTCTSPGHSSFCQPTSTLLSIHRPPCLSTRAPRPSPLATHSQLLNSPTQRLTSRPTFLPPRPKNCSAPLIPPQRHQIPQPFLIILKYSTFIPTLLQTIPKSSPLGDTIPPIPSSLHPHNTPAAFHPAPATSSHLSCETMH